MLKRSCIAPSTRPTRPAAFGRLCVETSLKGAQALVDAPAAFGRLCVETAMMTKVSALICPAAFGRLCVETNYKIIGQIPYLCQPPSGGCVLKLRLAVRIIGIGLPAAFGRLCVETLNALPFLLNSLSSRLRAAVC